MMPSLLWPFGKSPIRRRARAPFGAISSEALELRQMLSAVNELAVDPVPAAVALKVEYPEVGGEWDVAFGENSLGLSESSMTVTQKKGKLTVDLDLGELGIVTLKGKIDKNDLHSASIKTNLKTPAGKLAISADVTFDETFNAFTGTIHVSGFSDVEVSGTQTEQMLSAPRGKVVFPDVSGDWVVTVDENPLGLDTVDMSVTQKKGKMTAEVDLGELGVQTFKGKFSKKDLVNVVMKAKASLPGIGKVNVSVDVAFGPNYDLFSGQLAIQGYGSYDVDGAKSMAADSPLAAPRAKVTAPDVTGTWDLEIEPNDFDVDSGTLQVSQKGLKVISVLTLNGLDGSFTVKGKFNKSDLENVFAKTKLPVPVSETKTFNLRVDITIDFNEAYTQFDGNIHRSIFGNELVDVNFTGTKQV